VEQVLHGSGRGGTGAGGAGSTMYKHVSKCKNNKIKEEKEEK
jgi:hypothetical protein